MFKFLREWWNRSKSDPYYLASGPNPSGNRRCALEWCSWLEGNVHSALPVTVDRDLIDFTAGVNDTLYGGQRQSLKPYLARMIGTRGDGFSDERVRVLEIAFRRVKNSQMYGHVYIPSTIYGLGCKYTTLFGKTAALKIIEQMLPSEIIDFSLIEEKDAAREVFSRQLVNV